LFSQQNPVLSFLSLIRATCTAALIYPDFTTRITFGEEHKLGFFSLRSFLQSLLCTYRHIPSSAPSVNVLSSVLDQVLHPHKTTQRIIILYIPVVTLLDSKREDERFCIRR
jgi:hypothetical protein